MIVGGADCLDPMRAVLASEISSDDIDKIIGALETLGVNWGKVLPIPNFDATQYPEVKKLMDLGAHRKQHHFRLDGSEMGKIFHGDSPANDGYEVETTDKAPEGAPIAGLPERPEEFAPGLTRELLEMVAAVNRFK